MRLKITLCFWSCLSLAFAILLITTQVKTQDLGISITQDLTEQLVASKAAEIGSWFGQQIGQMRIAGEHEGLDQLDSDSVLSYINRINRAVQNDDVNLNTAYALVNDTGFGWADALHSVDLFDKDYFQTAMRASADYSLSLPTTSPVDGVRAIMISYPLSHDGDRYGCMVGSLAVSQLEKALSSIHVFDGFVWIMDKGGHLIAESAVQNAQDARSPRRFSLEALAVALNQQDCINSVTLSDGSQSYLTSAIIPSTPQWMLCVLTSDQAMYAETRSVKNSIIAVWICLLVVAYIACMILADSLTRPLTRLRAAMDAVDGGAHDIAIPVKGRDEVAALGRSFNAMLERIRALIAQVSQEQEAKRTAELRALQAQITPHFIYNTLETLKWKALAHDAFEVADITEALSSFFRISLSEGREFIVLDQEVEHVYHYLFIQRVRFANKLSFDIDMEPCLNKIPVPKLILQPLVENSLQHGIKPICYHGHIGVTLRPAGNRVIITVEDNGAGMSPKRLAQLRQSLLTGDVSVGYGLYNINARLKVVYRADFSIQIESESGKGTRVTISLPQRLPQTARKEDGIL